MYPFRLSNRVIEVTPYLIKPFMIPVSSLSEATQIVDIHGGEIEKIDTTEHEWLDGIEVADVPDTFVEAVKIYEMGQAAYQELLNTPTPEEDTMAMMVDHEYRLTVLEVMS